MPSALKPILSDSPSAATPRMTRQPQDLVALRPATERLGDHLDVAERRLCRIELSVLMLGALLGARLAHRHGPGRDAAHHHALEHGLAADWGVAHRTERSYVLGLRSGGEGRLTHTGCFGGSRPRHGRVLALSPCCLESGPSLQAPSSNDQALGWTSLHERVVRLVRLLDPAARIRHRPHGRGAGRAVISSVVDVPALSSATLPAAGAPPSMRAPSRCRSLPRCRRSQR